MAKPLRRGWARNLTDNDGTIDKKEFEAACGKGLVKYTSR
jgi:hypothetical protein